MNPEPAVIVLLHIHFGHTRVVLQSI